MSQVIYGLDIGKSTFHLIGRDSHGHKVIRKKFTRAKLLEFFTNHSPTTVALEACAGAHWLGQQLQSRGQQVKLLPPQYVKPYVKTNKNDYIDAAAIVEASTRPDMRFVPVKTEQQQLLNVLYRIRQGYIRERTALMYRIGGILLDFGLSLPRGHAKMKALFFWLAQQSHELPPLLMNELIGLHEHYLRLNENIAEQNKTIKIQIEKDAKVVLLKTIPGVGDQVAAQCLGNIVPSAFKNGRHLAAWIGLVPRQHSTGGKNKLLGISKRGNKTLRELLIHGARDMLSRPELAEKAYGKWITELREKKPFNVALVALANKLARITWSVMSRQEPFKVAQANV
ncbi:IS110 family transposase [Thiomicrorhabdus indica]|uniref:IS110 family transposase n=1 Tax=Thiomicrorhabdus indica TaxID=2267253 RepID=UPI002AA907C6|nr:IS110 family transposase [Thiomicrorhabdus indica]